MSKGGDRRSPSGYLRPVLLIASALGLWIVLQSLLGAGGIDLATLEWAAPKLAHGMGLTIAITVSSVLLGAILAGILTLGLLARPRPIRAISRFWLVAFRGTPLIGQLYLVYYGAGEIHRALDAVHLWWFFREPLNCVLLTFTCNTAAYQARIIYGAIAALPQQQTDAARALALSWRITLWRILLPQALLVALRPLGNEITKMTKASAVASLVTVLDLLGTVKLLFSQTLDFSFYILAAVLYVLLIGVIRLALDGIERHLSRHLSQPAGA